MAMYIQKCSFIISYHSCFIFQSEPSVSVVTVFSTALQLAASKLYLICWVPLKAMGEPSSAEPVIPVPKASMHGNNQNVALCALQTVQHKSIPQPHWGQLLKCCFVPHCCFEFPISQGPSEDNLLQRLFCTYRRPASGLRLVSGARMLHTQKSSPFFFAGLLVEADSVHVCLGLRKHMG